MSMLSSIYPAESPDHMRRRKIVKKGFQLCLMVCGRTGTGKSTFVNTLCDGKIFSDSERQVAVHEDGITRDMQIRTHKVDLCEEDGTVIALTVVDTPGFGDNIDNSKCCGTILNYLETQFDEVLAEESRVHRNPRFDDKRVQVCLYFIAATGHGLRELDIDLMSTLSRRVNIIPVIAKADTFTDEELIINKTKILADIEHYKIPIFSFNYAEDETDQEVIDECVALRALLPFAVVGSDDIYEVDSQFVRGRSYPWGFVSTEDPEFSDFSYLRTVIFGSHLQELRDLTHDVIYEKYRSDKLSANASLIPPRINDNRSYNDSIQETGSLGRSMGRMAMF